MYELRFSAAALKALKKAPKDVVERIRAKLHELAEDPYAMPNVKKLTNHPGFRLRVNEWRIIYLIQEMIIHIMKIGKRKDIY